jgi:hypothetical protein
MSYTVDDYVEEYTKTHLHCLTKPELLRWLTSERRVQQPYERLLRGLTPEQRLQGLAPDEVLSRFSPDQRLHGLSPDQRLHGLSPDEIEAYLSKLKSQRSH